MSETPIPTAVQIVAPEINAISPGLHAQAMAYRIVFALTDAGLLHAPCDRPFSPTHDVAAPGPTSRHPFTKRPTR